MLTTRRICRETGIGYTALMIARTDEPDEVVARRLRCYWFSSLREISDLALQRRRWLDPANRNPHWSYIEFVCSYPDHDQLADAHARGWLTAAEFRIMSEFLQTLSAHSAPTGDDHDNAAVLDDPAWHAVVTAAQLARQELISVVTDDIARQTLLGVELDSGESAS